MTDEVKQTVADRRAVVVDQTVIGSCLHPLLQAMNWRGSKQKLKEVMPHYSQIYNITMFKDVFEHLNYECREVPLSLKEVDDRLLPCLFIAEEGNPMVLLKRDKKGIHVFDGEANKMRAFTVDEIASTVIVGRAYAFRYKTKADANLGLHISWVRKTYYENKRLVHTALFLSLVLNLLALSTPLFIMGVYNRVIGASSYHMLWQFAIGVAIALCGIVVVNRLRSNLLAILGARVDKAIGNHIFQRLLYLSPVYTESATVGSQVARIKDFDRLREFFSGPLLATFFDVPFIVVSIIIIGALGSWLMLVPISMVIAYAILGLSLRPRVKRRVSRSSWNAARLQEFLLESMTDMRAVKYLAAEDVWLNRYREMSANSTLMSMRLSLLSAFSVTCSDVIMILAGMAVISFGAVMVINATLSVGGMIAIMVLIWRVLAPLKTIFNTLPRLQQMSSSLSQISRLMDISPESDIQKVNYENKRKIIGPIQFSRVSYRYQAASEPAVLGMDFSVAPGEIIGVVGPNGSGKSSILKLILGMYQPQAGSIRIDNQDIRQINPIELRNGIGYLPQKPELFYGSIAANLRLAKPDASDQDLQRAAQQAGILEDILSLPKGFDTSLRDFSTQCLASSFQQLLCLARAYLKNAKILLLDEPGSVLDREADEMLMRSITSLRGKAAVMMVTHRPSHLKAMDRIFVIDKGQLVMQGKPEEVFQKIPKGML